MKDLFIEFDDSYIENILIELNKDCKIYNLNIKGEKYEY